MTPGARDALHAAAQALRVQLDEVHVATASELEDAFARMDRAQAAGVLVRSDPYVLEANSDRVVALAAKHRLPAVYWLSVYPQSGGLASYGADLLDIQRRAASYYVDRILRGGKPADLPIQEPAKFSVVVNLKTAQALGLSVPPSVLARADEVLR